MERKITTQGKDSIGCLLACFSLNSQFSWLRHQGQGMWWSPHLFPPGSPWPRLVSQEPACPQQPCQCQPSKHDTWRENPALITKEMRVLALKSMNRIPLSFFFVCSHYFDSRDLVTKRRELNKKTNPDISSQSGKKRRALGAIRHGNALKLEGPDKAILQVND